jgi:hypothetical protein
MLCCSADWRDYLIAEISNLNHLVAFARGFCMSPFAKVRLEQRCNCTLLP